MLTDDVLKALIEGIIYVAPEPVPIEAILKTLEGEERERVKAKLDELIADYQQNQHGIQIRQVANGYKFSTKAEHHETLRTFVRSLKPTVRLSKPALETLAVIAYRQPVTLPEIEAIRAVDVGGVIHTLLEKKLVVTSGRKNVVGRPILYRTSRDFLVHFGLKDVNELPSLKEFEELAKRALGEEMASEVPSPGSEVGATPGADSAEAGAPPVDAGPSDASAPAAVAPSDISAPAAEAEPVSQQETQENAAEESVSLAAEETKPGENPEADTEGSEPASPEQPQGAPLRSEAPPSDAPAPGEEATSEPAVDAALPAADEGTEKPEDTPHPEAPRAEEPPTGALDGAPTSEKDPSLSS